MCPFWIARSSRAVTAEIQGVDHNLIMSTIKFAKMQAAGNDFVVIEAKRNRVWTRRCRALRHGIDNI